MPKTTLLDTSTVSMAELLGNSKIYRVPPYQRDYSWTEENWEDLWNDIIAMREGEESRHYMGSVVLQAKSDKEFTIIDGQQRLTTVSLIAIAVIKRLSQLVEQGVDTDNNRERVEILRRTFLGDKDPKSLLYSSKLFLNANNDDFYQSYVLQLRTPPNPHKLSATDRLLWQAFQYYYEKLNELGNAVHDGVALTGFLTEDVASKLLFIQIVVQDELSAYTVFETLNARGIGLTPTDLLKNYLFSLVRSEHDLQHIQRQWQRIANTVRTDKLPEFLRHLVNSQQSYIRSQRLFKVVQQRIQTGQKALELLDELEREADVYVALFDASHERWRGNREARQYVRALRVFNVKQLSPLLLAAYRGLSEQDFLRVLKLCEIISFRYNIISTLNTNELEKYYNLAAVAIHKQEVTSPAQLFSVLKPIYVTDERFEHDFAYKVINTTRRKKLVRYILFKLEYDLSGNTYDFEDDPASIEHILPENPSALWTPAFPVDVQESFINRLGNYTLLEPNLNRDLQNAGFQEKRQCYTGSRYALSRGVQQQEWTMESLSRRQEQLAQRAKHIWRSDFA